MALELDTLHGIIDNLQSDHHNTEFIVKIHDVATSEDFEIKEIFGNPDDNTFTIVIDTGASI